MSKPTTLPVWSTTGPITVPTSGKQAAGFVPGERGAAQYFNWYMHLVYLWLIWSARERVRTYSPMSARFTLAAWTDDAGGGPNGSLFAAAAGNMYLPLALDVGDRIRAIRVYHLGNGSTSMTIKVNKKQVSGASTTLCTLTVVPPGSWQSSWINFAADTGVMSIAAGTSGGLGTLTRTTGSFITDGFVPGMTITVVGYATGGNNGSKVIGSMTATVITLTTDLTTEAATGDERLTVDPVLVSADPTSFSVVFTAASPYTPIEVGTVSVSSDDGSLLLA